MLGIKRVFDYISSKEYRKDNLQVRYPRYSLRLQIDYQVHCN